MRLYYTIKMKQNSSKRSIRNELNSIKYQATLNVSNDIISHKNALCIFKKHMLNGRSHTIDVIMD